VISFLPESRFRIQTSLIAFSKRQPPHPTPSNSTKEKRSAPQARNLSKAIAEMPALTNPGYCLRRGRFASEQATGDFRSENVRQDRGCKALPALSPARPCLNSSAGAFRRGRKGVMPPPTRRKAVSQPGSTLRALRVCKARCAFQPCQIAPARDSAEGVGTRNVTGSNDALRGVEQGTGFKLSI
jgi:hypothetical protein